MESRLPDGSSTSMKRTAHSVNRGFTTVKRDFTSVERGFSSVKMTFTSVKSTFTSVERRNLKYAIPDPVYLGNPLTDFRRKRGQLPDLN